MSLTPEDLEAIRRLIREEMEQRDRDREEKALRYGIPTNR